MKTTILHKIAPLFIAGLFIFIFHNRTYAKSTTDSLKQVWHNKNMPDTMRMNALNQFTWKSYLFSRPDSAYFFAHQMYLLAKKKNNFKYIISANNIKGISWAVRNQSDSAISYFKRNITIAKKDNNLKDLSAANMNIGNIYRQQGQFDEAIKYYTISAEVADESNDVNMQTKLYVNLGLIYEKRGDVSGAVKSYTKALKAFEKVKDPEGINSSLINLGNIYYNQEEYDVALKYYFKTIKASKKTNNKLHQAHSIINVGMVYKKKEMLDSALHYYNKALTVFDESSIKIKCYGSIGQIYLEQEKIDTAEVLFKQCIKLSRSAGDLRSLATNQISLASVFNAKKEFQKAKILAEKALEFAALNRDLSLQKQAYEMLWKTNKKLGNFKESLLNHERFIDLNDSIKSEENIKEIYKQEYAYEYEKKALADSIVNAEHEKIQVAKINEEKAKNEQQTQQKYFLLFGLLIAVGLIIFVFNRLKVTRKQKGIIEEKNEEVVFQKNKIEEAHKEITDSINYAKRIQSAILPPQKNIDLVIKQNFVLYLPKDVVAGDFYWLEQTENEVFIAAADCTGHGVPGALVSVVCHNALNRSVREFGLREPGEILDKTREIVIQEFEKSEEEVKDGMDIALCALHSHSHSRSHSVLQYAGANNPAWIVKSDTKELIELKANKQPIGKYENATPFDTKNLSLNEGDMIYIFSDGYADQFGGPNGKKFKSKNFKKLLTEVAAFDVYTQKEKLKINFEEWSSGFDQLDDICVIGIRV